MPRRYLQATVQPLLLALLCGWIGMAQAWAGCSMTLCGVGSAGVPWTPLNDPGLIEWWDSTQGVTGTANVTNWAGRLGSHPAANVTGANRPSYSTPINGVAALAFSNAFLTIATFTQPAEYTMLAVLQPTNNTGNQSIVDGDNEVTRQAQFIVNSTGTQNFLAFNTPGSPFTALAGSFTTAACLVTSYHPLNSITATFNGTDGTPVGVTLGDAAQNSIITFGDHSAVGGTRYTGTMGDVIYTTTSTTSTKQKMEGFEAWKFGLQGSLPGGHPYKSRPPLVSDP